MRVGQAHKVGATECGLGSSSVCLELAKQSFVSLTDGYQEKISTEQWDHNIRRTLVSAVSFYLSDSATWDLIAIDYIYIYRCSHILCCRSL